MHHHGSDLRQDAKDNLLFFLTLALLKFHLVNVVFLLLCKAQDVKGFVGKEHILFVINRLD